MKRTWRGLRAILILMAVCAWGGASYADGQAPKIGYISTVDLPPTTSWLPPMPVAPSGADASDATMFFGTRAVLSTPRGQMAAEDDVYDPAPVAARFAVRLGLPLDKLPADSQLLQLMQLA